MAAVPSQPVQLVYVGGYLTVQRDLVSAMARWTITKIYLEQNSVELARPGRF